MMSDSLKRVARTFVIAFVGVALPGALSWLHNLTTWANDGGQTAFPDAKSLAFLGISAIIAGFIAALNLIVVLIEDATGVGIGRQVPPTPPNVPPTP